MRKFTLFAVLLLTLAPTVLAQDRDEDWRRRRPRYNDAPDRDAVELTIFAGYRWGGTVFADNSFVFDEDLQVESSPSFGAEVGIPVGSSGMKFTLMASRQSSELETGSGLFEPDDEVADFDVTYFHGGLHIPFARSRNAVPYFTVSAGVANLDPQIAGLSDETRFSASAGLGVKVPMSRALSLRLEGRGFYTSLEDQSDCSLCDYFIDQNFYQGEVSAGLSVSF